MTLGETGQIVVSAAAVQQYAAARRLQTEEARREVTVLLTGARKTATQPDSGAEGWRIRSRAMGVDVGAHVAREGALAVVTHVSVRVYRPRSGRR